MTREEISTLIKLVSKYNYEQSNFSTFQVGEFIVQPLYWYKDDEGEVFIDEDSVRAEFENFIKNEISFKFIESKSL
jgi:hypothetical protein